jgi:hypothetical protein
MQIVLIIMGWVQIMLKNFVHNAMYTQGIFCTSNLQMYSFLMNLSLCKNPVHCHFDNITFCRHTKLMSFTLQWKDLLSQYIQAMVLLSPVIPFACVL